jgi:L-methionine (R)-S-oxide reductase
MDETSAREWLEHFLSDHGGQAGTIHRRHGEILELVASVNIPTEVVEVTRTIPRGKGMAGLAFERGAPVQTCNLQTDTSGDVRPGARAVDARAAVALPVIEAGEVRAVVGIAFGDERELDERTLAELSSAAAKLRLEP